MTKPIAAAMAVPSAMAVTFENPLGRSACNPSCRADRAGCVLIEAGYNGMTMRNIASRLGSIQLYTQYLGLRVLRRADLK